MHAHAFPDDIEALKRLVMEQAARIAYQDTALTQLQSALATEQQESQHRALLIEKLKLQIAQLKRARFGQSSERLDQRIEQLELIVEDLEAAQSQLSTEAVRETAHSDTLSAESAHKHSSDEHALNTRALPAHLPRETVEHTVSCACPKCGNTMFKIGDEVSEVLERIPASFKVVRHVRAKFNCASCQCFVQAPAPERVIDRGMAGASLLAHVLVSKYADHLPLYRQSQIYAREDVELSRSTLADWVGASARVLSPLVEALRGYVLSAKKLHADDTPVPVLDPARGRTKTGRLWTYVRDDRPAGSHDPPAAWYAYSPDRKGEHPVEHLQTFAGTLQADAYAGFEALYAEAQREAGRIYEAACWAHYPERSFMRRTTHGVGPRNFH